MVIKLEDVSAVFVAHQGVVRITKGTLKVATAQSALIGYSMEAPSMGFAGTFFVEKSSLVAFFYEES